jgi:fibro-slime domain-containing protein
MLHNSLLNTIIATTLLTGTIATTRSVMAETVAANSQLPATRTLTGTIRDFSIHGNWTGHVGNGHPDFETYEGNGRNGMVLNTLGSDGKPVYNPDNDNMSANYKQYAATPRTATIRFTKDKTSFDQWFRNVEGVNHAKSHSITLTKDANDIYTFDSAANNSEGFFPIDDFGYQKEGKSHNYGFTYEIQSEFTYKPGQTFTFSGDDDVFIFINGKLALDLGGLHPRQEHTIDLDAMATQLGIEPGKTYPLSFFYAERHTGQANLKIQTSIVFNQAVD